MYKQKKSLQNEVERIRDRYLTRQQSRSSKRSQHANFDDEQWITVRGTHILLNEEGVAQNGWAKGKKFKTATSKKSQPKKSKLTQKVLDAYDKSKGKPYQEVDEAVRNAIRKSIEQMEVGDVVTIPDHGEYIKTADDEYEHEYVPGKKQKVNDNYIVNVSDKHDKEKAPSITAVKKDPNKRVLDAYGNPKGELYPQSVVERAIRRSLEEMEIGDIVTLPVHGKFVKTADDEYEHEYAPGKKQKVNDNYIANVSDKYDKKNAPVFKAGSR